MNPLSDKQLGRMSSYKIQGDHTSVYHGFLSVNEPSHPEALFLQTMTGQSTPVKTSLSSHSGCSVEDVRHALKSTFFQHLCSGNDRVNVVHVDDNFEEDCANSCWELINGLEGENKQQVMNLFHMLRDKNFICNGVHSPC